MLRLLVKAPLFGFKFSKKKTGKHGLRAFSPPEKSSSKLVYTSFKYLNNRV